MKRVLLTGATGFVGANLARRLLQEGHEVHLLVRPHYQTWRIAELGDRVQLHEASLEDAGTVQAILDQIHPDWIFHLAAYGAYPTQNDSALMRAVNISGTVNLVEAALRHGFEAFINTGSSSEYGYKDHAPSETEWLEPNSAYAVTKAAATQYCRFMAQKTNSNIQTVRLYSIYGPWEEPTRLIPTVIRCGLKGELPPLVNPTIARDFVYIEDTLDAYLAAVRTKPVEPGAVYNVGTGTQTTISQVVDVARSVLPIHAKPSWNSMPDRQWDTSVWVANNQTIQQSLGWKPRFTFEQGFKATVEWSKKR